MIKLSLFEKLAINTGIIVQGRNKNGGASGIRGSRLQETKLCISVTRSTHVFKKKSM